jgi:hypothetical protein
VRAHALLAAACTAFVGLAASSMGNGLFYPHPALQSCAAMSQHAGLDGKA